jgi:hypothetical protein
MILTLIENHEYEFLLDMQKKFPNLTFEHKPYQQWIPKHFTEDDLNALKEIKKFLSNVIFGFKDFTNFYYDKNGYLYIRFYYDWSWSMDDNGYKERTSIPFTGVGYLLAIELLKGFRLNEKNAKLSDIVVGVRFKHHKDEFDYTVQNITDEVVEVTYQGELVQFTLEEFKATILPYIILLDDIQQD